MDDELIHYRWVLTDPDLTPVTHSLCGECCRDQGMEPRDVARDLFAQGDGEDRYSWVQSSVTCPNCLALMKEAEELWAMNHINFSASGEEDSHALCGRCCGGLDGQPWTEEAALAIAKELVEHGYALPTNPDEFVSHCTDCVQLIVKAHRA